MSEGTFSATAVHFIFWIQMKFQKDLKNYKEKKQAKECLVAFEEKIAYIL